MKAKKKEKTELRKRNKNKEDGECFKFQIHEAQRVHSMPFNGYWSHGLPHLLILKEY